MTDRILRYKDIEILGELRPQDAKAVAIVGTRTPTTYGKDTAYRFACELAKNGVTIISGLARGIDTVAHEAALQAGGRTVAVLGSGLNIIYPPENKALARKIVKHGALVSQFAVGTKPLGKNFLLRNELIVRLSLAVVIVEGRQKSGTLSTAGHAANLGIEVFAVPGPINSPMSAAPHYLIEQGARVAKSPEDVLEYVNSLLDISDTLHV
jgi:DNA processing protein